MVTYISFLPHRDVEQHVHMKVSSNSSPTDPVYLSEGYMHVQSDILYHKVLSCSHNSLSALDKKVPKKKKRLSSAFGRIFSNRKTVKCSEHHITMPITYLPKNHSNTLGLPTLEHWQTSSCPDLLSTLSKSETIPYGLGSSTDTLHSEPARERSKIPLVSLSPNNTQTIASFSKLHCRSTMPLPLTPLDLATSKDSVSSGTNSTSVKECSLSPIPFPTTFVDDIDENDNHNNAQTCKRLNDYENIDDFAIDPLLNSQEESLLASNSGKAVTVVGKATVSFDDEDSMASKGQNDKDSVISKRLANATTVDDEASSKAAMNEESLYATYLSATTDAEIVSLLDDNKDYVISDHEFFEGLKQTQQASDDYLTILSPDLVLSSMHADYAEIQDVKQQDCQEENEDKGPTQVEATIDDQCTASKHCEVSKLDSVMSDYIYMHKATYSPLMKGSQAYTYDYIDELYIEMLRHKNHRTSTGVPPRNVKRTGHKPSVDISTCSNAKNTHNINHNNLIKQYGRTMLPPRQCHATDLERSNVTPPRNIPRPGYYLSAPPAGCINTST